MSLFTVDKKVAQRRIDAFERQYGQLALLFASHAALPVAFNPGFIHFLRVNFFMDPPEVLPPSIESALLLSSLCREIGDELYEMDVTIRNLLLEKLVREYSSKRLRDVAQLLWDYTSGQNKPSPWSNLPRLERAQKLTVLNFLAPDKAREWLDVAEQGVQKGARDEEDWVATMRVALQETINVGVLNTIEKLSLKMELMVEVFTDGERIENLGVFVRSDGYVLTMINEKKTNFTIRTRRGIYPSILINYLKDTGLALLKISEDGFPALEFSEYVIPEVNSDIYYFMDKPNNELALISGKFKGIAEQSYKPDITLYQIESSISPSFLFSPVFSNDGGLVGLLGFYSKAESGTAFLFPIDPVRQFLEQSLAVPSILLLTALTVETQAVLEIFSRAAGHAWKRQRIGGQSHYFLGMVGGANVYMLQREMGTNSSYNTFLPIRQSIEYIRPRAIISVGVAIGLHPRKEKLGDILVAKQLISYEPAKRDKKNGGIQHGDHIDCSSILYSKFQFGNQNWGGANVHFGSMLSSKKLISGEKIDDQLLKFEPEAIGWEMESSHLYLATKDAKVDWGVVKSIYDWADGKKKDDSQLLAAQNAADFVRHIIQLGGWDQLTNLEQAYSEEQASKLKLARETYLSRLLRKCQILPLAAFGGEYGYGNDITLDNVYVNLNTTEIQEFLNEASAREKKLGVQGIIHRSEKDKAVTALEAASEHKRLVLLGDSGAGKSTCVKKLLGWQAAACLGQVQPIKGIDVGLLPVFINLRDLAPNLAKIDIEHMPSQKRDEKFCETISEYILANLGSDQPDFGAVLQENLLTGACLLVLDGLDEGPQAMRRHVRLAVEALLRSYELQRVIITCRLRSYVGNAILSQFTSRTLAPFTEEQIGTFVTAWYDTQRELGHLSNEQAQVRANDLANAARQSDLRELSSNPMLLTMMAIIHQRAVAMPRERVCLYKLMVDVLLRGWQKHKLGEGYMALSDELLDLLKDENRLLDVMERLAYEAHRISRADKAKANLPRLEALHILEDNEYLGSLELAKEFLDFVEQRAGLMRGDGGDLHKSTSYSFLHRTFQEYLAGCYLIRDRSPWRKYATLATQGDYWTLVAVLGAEELYYNQRRQMHVLDLAYHLLPSAQPISPLEQRLALWSGLVAHIAGRDEIVANETGRAYIKKIASALLAVLRGDLPPVERAEAGRLLAAFGDPRREVVDSVQMAFCDIPTGEFIFGEGREQKKIYLFEYWIGKYPVTNAQYAQFVMAGGYANSKYWREAFKLGYWEKGQVYSKKWDSQPRIAPIDFGKPFNLPNHPVVGISRYEALAYCQWLSEKLGRDITLPTQEQWEKAVRGSSLTKLGDRPTYPWGNDADSNRTNSNITGLNTTSAVGCFLDRESPYGLLDAWGNIREWTSSPHDQISYVLRGVSYSDSLDTTDITFHHRYNPLYADKEVGFRVVAGKFFTNSSEHSKDIRETNHLSHLIVEYIPPTEYRVSWYVANRAVVPTERVVSTQRFELNEWRDETEETGKTAFTAYLPERSQQFLRTQLDWAILLTTNRPDIPWELLHDDNNFLCLSHPMGRRPEMLREAKVSPARKDGPLRALIVGNPTGDLPGAEAEANTIAETLVAAGVEVELLLEEKATAKQFAKNIRNRPYDLIHFAGYAYFEPRKPSLSGLMFCEGPMSAEELGRHLNSHALVVLSACEAGMSKTTESKTGLVGEFIDGIATSVLLGGAIGCLAQMWEVGDGAAKTFSLCFYQHLLDGKSIGESVRQARLFVQGQKTLADAWKAWILYGDPLQTIHFLQKSQKRLIQNKDD